MEQVRVGFIGCGGFAQGIHLPIALANPKYRIVAACDTNQAAADQVKSKSGCGYATTDVRAVLEDKNVDAVFIMTRHDSHAALSVAAARAGKHVLCEKPMGLSLAECRAVAEAVTQAKVKYTVGYNRGLAPLIVKARELFAGETAKKLIYHRIQAPFPASHWTHDPAVGGGRFVGEGCHIFDLLCELVGRDPVSVYASGGTFLPPDLVKIPDSGIVTITFADGSVGTTLIASDGCAQFPKEATEIYCAAKAVFINDFRELSYFGFVENGTGVITLKETDKGHRRELDLFADAVLRGTPAPNGVAQALRAAIISFLVSDSIRENRSVAIKRSDYQAENP